MPELPTPVGAGAAVPGTGAAHPAPRPVSRRRPLEIAFWVIDAIVGTVAASLTVHMDHVREGLAYAAWEPWVWEGSSRLMVLLLVPAVVWFTARWPLHFDTWRRHLPLYLLASLAWSLLHVGGMVALREAAYAVQGLEYDFGDVFRQFGYEYLKDIRSFAGIVLVLHLYRFVLRRLQGEAALLSPPDDGSAPVEPVDRPERFLVRKLGREFLVAARDIEHVQAAGNYANLHVHGREYPLRTTLSELEQRLDPARFTRVHRSWIVNLDAIESIEPLESGDARLLMRGGTQVPCSRRYRDRLRNG